MKQYTGTYTEIVTLENLLQAWQEFLRGKRNREDVIRFGAELMDNLLILRRELLNKTYTHSKYYAFNISDPKPRNIHKASVRDRLLHHLLYNALYPYFDSKFIFDSYSCRIGKGTHRAVERFKTFINKTTKNNTKTVWVLKCDIRMFFATIDHNILFQILESHIDDKQLVNLLKNIIQSFNPHSNKGLPLGNLTSQLLVNIYMNEFDQYVKHTLKCTHYIRYADDFVFLNTDKTCLENLLPVITSFLQEKLQLSLHPDKIFIKTIDSGVDFLGWIVFPRHQVLRTATKKRMLRRLIESQKPETIASYKGMLSHGNAHKLEKLVYDLAVGN